MKRIVKKGMFVLPVAVLIAAVALFSAASSDASLVLSEQEDWDFPRLDEIYMVEAYPGSFALETAKTCEIDGYIGAIRPNEVSELNESAWSISMNPGFHMCYLGINCRDATPNSSGQYADYHGRTAGYELYPLNISAFRWALHLLVGDQKDQWTNEHGCLDYYESLNARLDTVIPPANRFWFNPDIPPVPYDPAEAYNVLTAAGFSNATGYWICPNGQEMRHIYVLQLWDILCWPPPPIIENCVKSWNTFFGKMSDKVTDYFEWDLIGNAPEAFDIIFGNRDFDIYYLCWGLSREPDYLYDLFHPSMDVEAKWKKVNTVGLNHPPLNRLLYMLKHGEDPDTHRLITDIDKMKQICYDAQWHLYNQTPYIPLYSRNCINLYKSGLTCWVESEGYGSAPYHLEMPWTYCSIHWEGQPVGGSINWHVPGDVHTLNPGIAEWVYYWISHDVAILNRIYDSLIVVNPYTHEDMPWAALHWTMEPYINETENVLDGMAVKFWLRNDLYWHDGLHVTAHDIKWNWDFIKRMGETEHFNPLSDAWSTYIKSKVIHDYLIEVHVNKTGLWQVHNYARNALKFPKIIWEPFWDDPEGAEAFKPWNTTYQEWTGNPPPPDKPDLKCLIGTGPFWLDYWNEKDTAHLLKNSEYWVRKAPKLQGCPQLAGLTTQTQFTKEVDGRLVPVITKQAFLDVVISNTDTKANCTLSYEVFMDETTPVASGGPITLNPCGSTHIASEIPLDLPPCIHTWELVVHAATGDNTYVLEAAYLITDINGDGKVDIVDLVLLIKAFGSYPSHPRWKPNSDINGDDKVDIIDLVLQIKNFGETCLC